MSDFISSAREELQELENKTLIENEQVKDLVTRLKEKTLSITFEGISIRIPAAIPHEVKETAFAMGMRRKELEEEGASLDEVLEPTYQMLAGICMDHPWNKAETWRFIEHETGASDKVLGKILEAISESDKKIKKIR